MRPVILTKEHLTHVDQHHYVTEASSIGCMPGQWPTQLSVDPMIGNGNPLLRMAPEYRDGEVVAVTYRQAWGIVTVRVFND